MAYIAYRFIFGFVLPVAKATRTVRRQFKAAQEEMEARMRQQNAYQENNSYGPASGYGTSSARTQDRNSDLSKGEYIEFEEVK
ncbi:MAG TPA: hypothetical protein VIK80_16740 [Flavihumibacter sp.]